MANPPVYISTRLVGQVLGVHVRTVQDLVRRGELPAIRVGKVLRIREDHLDAYIAAQAVPVRDVS